MCPIDFRMGVAVVLLGNKKLYSPIWPGDFHKASRRYHGNHQENNMSIGEAPCEAFNLMHILELPIVGHIKTNK